MNSSTDRRQHPRKPLEINVLVHVGGGGQPVKGISLDVSRGGIFVRTPESVRIGQRVDAFIDTHHVKSGPILIGGTVAHSVLGYGLGIEFTRATRTGLARVDSLVRELKPN